MLLDRLGTQFKHQPLDAVGAQSHFEVIGRHDHLLHQQLDDPGPLFTPESWVVNSRIALKAIDLGIGEGEIAIWGRNLTDNDYPTYALNTGGLAASSSFMEARSYGVDFIVQF